VFAISLKDRAAVLPAGFSGDGAYWIDGKTGAWITSTYYRQDLPEWVKNFNGGHRADKYWNREWKDSDGRVLASTAPRAGKDGTPAGFYEVVGATPFANDYQFEFAKEAVLYEKLGTGPATDLLVVSLSANDILGHRVGPDSPAARQHDPRNRPPTGRLLQLSRAPGRPRQCLDRALRRPWHCAPAGFREVSPPPRSQPRFQRSARPDQCLLSKRYAKKADYFRDFDFPLAWLNEDAFASAGRKESDAEADTGDAMRQAGFLGYFTKSQLSRGTFPTPSLGGVTATAILPTAVGT